jgi:hypothetical protein
MLMCGGAERIKEMVLQIIEIWSRTFFNPGHFLFFLFCNCFLNAIAGAEDLLDSKS